VLLNNEDIKLPKNKNTTFLKRKKKKEPGTGGGSRL
jgi:hypothetical protein